MPATSSVTPGCGSTTALNAPAKFGIGNTEPGPIMHPGHRMQRRLDLGRVNIDAARDHHVALAVADEDIAVFIAITDVARGDKAVAVDLGALFRLVVIGKIRIARYARIDLADLARRQHASVIADKK